MGLLEQIQRGRTEAPRRVLLYGTQGIGKSTFGAMANRPVFIQTEDGLGMIDCVRFPLVKLYHGVIEALGTLYSEQHDFQTVVVDTLDWLERLIWAEVCREKKVKSIEEIPYQKGYTYALTYWSEILEGLDSLRNERDMTVILLAHSAVEKVADPELDTYNRYSPRLHKFAAALVQEWCDEVLFARYQVHTVQAKEAFDKVRNKGIGTGQRIVYTTERPGYLAKNRLGLPDQIPLDYRVYSAFVRGENPLADAQEPVEQGV